MSDLDGEALRVLANVLRSPALSDLCQVELIVLTDSAQEYPDQLSLREQWSGLDVRLPLSFRFALRLEYNYMQGTPPLAATPRISG